MFNPRMMMNRPPYMNPMMNPMMTPMMMNPMMMNQMQHMRPNMPMQNQGRNSMPNMNYPLMMNQGPREVKKQQMIPQAFQPQKEIKKVANRE